VDSQAWDTDRMTARAKIPLQDVVGSICDALADLPPDDQARALEAVRLTLGLGDPVARPTWETAPPQEAPAARPWEPAPQEPQEGPAPRPLWGPSLLQEAPARRPLPTVVVQMMGDRPMVVGQQVGRPGRSLVVVGPQRDQRRQLSPPPVPADSPADAVPTQPQTGSRRGGYVRSIR